MADRVHPTPLLPLSSSPTPPPAPDHNDTATATAETAPLHPSFHRAAPSPSPPPPPGTSYIVQIPKDQVLRVPPPDRARRYKQLAARPARRRLLRRACCGACCALLALLLLAAAFVGVLYLVFRPKAPSFSVASLSIHGLDAVTPSSVELDAAVRADNGANKKVGVDYRGGGEVTVSYSGVQLAAGRWPAFYQAPRKAVRVRFGKAVRTWTVDVWARCDVTVDRLAGEVAAAAKNREGCRVKVRPLWWWW